MKNQNLSLFLFVLFLFSACAEKNLTKDEEAHIKEEVSTMFNSYSEHVNTKGLQGVEAYFSESADFYWVEDGLLQYPDSDALKEGIAAFAPSVSGVHINISEFDIKVLDHQRVSIFADFKQDITLKSGFSFTIDGIMTIITQKEEEGWKFLIGHSSVEKPRGGN